LIDIVTRLRSYFAEFGSTFFILWSVFFLATFAISVCDPALPYLVGYFVVEESAFAVVIGYLNSILNLSRTATNFLAGFLVDKIGKREVILASICLSPISFIFYFFSNNCYWLFAAALISGISSGLSSPSFTALIADVSPETSRAKAFAVFNLSWMLSGIPAPIIGGYLSSTFNVRLPFIFAFTLSVIIILLLLKTFGNIKEGSSTKLNCAHSSKNDLKHYGTYARVLVLFCIISLLLGFGDGMLMPITTAFLMFRLGTSAIGMGITFSVAFGIAMALSQIPGAKITEMLGKKRIILVSILIATPLLILLPFTTSLIQFVAIFGLINFISYLWSPALSAWVANSIETSRRGKAYGFTSAAYGLGSIAGPALGGIIWAFFQPNTLLPFVMATIPFFVIIPTIAMLKE